MSRSGQSEDMLVLGIETSCDETSAAVVEDGCKVLSCIIATSEKDFASLGGVIPEQAARAQVECIIPTVKQALNKAELEPADMDLIAVTGGPGLLGSLLVGTSPAIVLSRTWNKPLIAVHHTLGHLSSTWLDLVDDDVSFPLLTLSVSGGHSDLWYRKSHTNGKLLGSTRDDAAGEAFDKGASLLGLLYPGGPSIAKAAADGDEQAFDFTEPLKNESTLDFSFSGLKTALKYTLRDMEDYQRESGETKRSLAASYQLAICKHLCGQMERAIKRYPEVKEIHIVGGVSANSRLRQMAEEVGARHHRKVRYPGSLRYCTDNGAMIAAAGYFLAKEQPEKVGETFKTEATIPLAALLKSS